MNLKQRLQNHLAEIVRDRDPYLSPIAHLYVQQYIRAQLQQWGTVETHEFTVNGVILIIIKIAIASKPSTSTFLLVSVAGWKLALENYNRI